jgi:hypothetical protein
MKKWYNSLTEFMNQYMDDLEILFIVGLPFGIVIILIHKCLDYSHLF